MAKGIESMEGEKGKAKVYFEKALSDLNPDVRRAMLPLLRDIAIKRKTDGELLATAFDRSLFSAGASSFTGRKAEDTRALDALSAIAYHENNLVGNNLTVAEAKEIAAN